MSCVRTFSILISLLLLTACAGSGLMNTNTPAAAGSAPANYEKAVLNHLNQILKDPDSLKNFSASQPILTSCSIGIYGPFNGWRSQVSYNAKNSYGGYVGTKTYYYWFHGERLKGVNMNPNFCPEAAGWF